MLRWMFPIRTVEFGHVLEKLYVLGIQQPSHDHEQVTDQGVPQQILDFYVPIPSPLFEPKWTKLPFEFNKQLLCMYPGMGSDPLKVTLFSNVLLRPRHSRDERAQLVFSGMTQNDTLDVDYLVKLHNIITPNALEKGLQKENAQRNAVQRKYSPLLLRHLFDTINEMMQSGKYHPLDVAAMAVSSVVKIHPFIDGNGRTARALGNVILARMNHVPAIYFDAESYYQVAMNDVEDIREFLTRCTSRITPVLDLVGLPENAKVRMAAKSAREHLEDEVTNKNDLALAEFLIDNITEKDQLDSSHARELLQLLKEQRDYQRAFELAANVLGDREEALRLAALATRENVTTIQNCDQYRDLKFQGHYADTTGAYAEQHVSELRYESLDHYLRRVPPSVTIGPIPWIYLNNPAAPPQRQFMVQVPQGASGFDLENIEDMFTGPSTAKYVINCTRDNVDERWGRVAKAIRSGQLEACQNAKVSTVTQSIAHSKTIDSFIICVYVWLYADMEARQSVRQALRDIAFIRDKETLARAKAGRQHRDSDVYAWE